MFQGRRLTLADALQSNIDVLALMDRSWDHIVKGLFAAADVPGISDDECVSFTEVLIALCGLAARKPDASLFDVCVKHRVLPFISQFLKRLHDSSTRLLSSFVMPGTCGNDDGKSFVVLSIVSAIVGIADILSFPPIAYEMAQTELVDQLVQWGYR